MTRLQLDSDAPRGKADPLMRREAREAKAGRILAAAAAKPSSPASSRPSTPPGRTSSEPPVELDSSTVAIQQPTTRLHQLLESLRQAAGLSIGELAEEVESTDADVKEILTGQAIPGHDFLNDLLQACQATVAQRLAARELLRTRAHPTSGHSSGKEYVHERLGSHVPRGGGQEPRQPAALLSSDELLIRTPADLAQVFQAVLDRAGLTAGQLAIKANISRSQVYSMKKAGTGSVPRNPEQISRWLFNCGVPPKQAHVIMERWKQLDVLRRQGKRPELGPAPASMREEELSLDGRMALYLTDVSEDREDVFRLRQIPDEYAGHREHICPPADADDGPHEPEVDPATIVSTAPFVRRREALVLEESRTVPAIRARGSLLTGVAAVLVGDYSNGRVLRTVATMLMLMVAIVVLLHLGPSTLGTGLQVVTPLKAAQ